MISAQSARVPFAQPTLARTLTEGQVQFLLQSLYSARAETRLEAIEHIVAHQWHDARLMQALQELAALDEVERVREKARGAVRQLESMGSLDM